MSFVDKLLSGDEVVIKGIKNTPVVEISDFINDLFIPEEDPANNQPVRLFLVGPLLVRYNPLAPSYARIRLGFLKSYSHSFPLTDDYVVSAKEGVHLPEKKLREHKRNEHVIASLNGGHSSTGNGADPPPS